MSFLQYLIALTLAVLAGALVFFLAGLVVLCWYLTAHGLSV